MPTYTCVCGFETSVKHNYERHCDKEYPCKDAPYSCKKCSRPFYSRSSMYRHQKTCPGKPQTPEEKDKQIEGLKIALAASAGLNAEIKAKDDRIQQQVVNNNNNTNNISIDQVNNVTQNIVILNCGEENIEHFRKMSVEELKNRIGMNKDPQTHIEAYKLIHLDPQHPENHNLLLPQKDGNQVHFYGNDKWNTGSFDEQIRLAVFDVNKAIQRAIPEKNRDDYYWNHLEHGIGTKCNNKEDAALRPIFEGLRDPLHESTLRLMGIDPTQEMVSGERKHDEASLEWERERTLQMKEKTRQLELTERTRQMELELQLAKMKAESR